MILEKDYRLLFAKNRKDNNMTVLMYAAKHNCHYVIDVIAAFIKHLCRKGLTNLKQSVLLSKVANWVNSKENKNGDTAYILCCRENKRVNTWMQHTMLGLANFDSFDFSIENDEFKRGSHYLIGNKMYALEYENHHLRKLYK